MPPVSYSPPPKSKSLFLFGKQGIQGCFFQVAPTAGRWHGGGYAYHDPPHHPGLSPLP